MKEELLVDSYYMYNFTGKMEGNKSQTPPTGRAFDLASNSFTLNYAKVGFQVDSDPVTVRADIGFGALAQAIGGSGGVFVQQAYASLKLPGTPLTIDFGRFVTTAGSEVIEANKNWLYSRSMLFFNIPLLHTGLRLNLKVNDQISLQGTVANGIFNDDPDNNAAKTFGASITIAPVSTTTIIATTYFGKEAPQGSLADDTRVTADLVVAHNVSDAFGLNLNFDYIKLGEANLFGVALMGRYVASEHFNLAARAEFLKDKNIYLTDGQEYEGTVAAAFPFGGHMEIRLELRGDFSDKEVYNVGGPVEAPALPELKKNQFTGTVAFLGYL